MLSTHDRVESEIEMMKDQLKAMEVKIDDQSTRNIPSFRSSSSPLSPFHTRVVPDARPVGCSSIVYPPDLPSATVVIVTFNERPSVLLRTVKSVLERTPDNLLPQIIVVDDFSDNLVDSDICILPRVKVIRNNERKGLIASRVLGADASATPIVVFLDAHCEANYGWLEPLLDRIAKNPKAVVWPVIDIIHYETFVYSPIDSHTLFGGMRMETLSYIYDSIPPAIVQKLDFPFEPIPSPTMPGGLFAIQKAYFNEIGSYDLGMGYWGTENLEISVRVWTCGGSIEMIPCSHVGHIFTNEKKAPDYVKHSGTRNQIRFADVWMDDYKNIFYENYHIKPTDIEKAGNVTQRVNLRNDLGCQSFKWYHENIYPQLKVDAKWYEKGWDLWRPVNN